jgi:hypothetical protein
LHRPAAVLPLLRRDANAAAAHRDGSTALHTIGANPEITEAEATAIVNARLAAAAYCTLSADPVSSTPRYTAVESRNVHVIAALLGAGADPTSRTDRYGRSPAQVEVEARLWPACAHRAAAVAGNATDPRGRAVRRPVRGFLTLQGRDCGR